MQVSIFLSFIRIWLYSPKMYIWGIRLSKRRRRYQRNTYQRHWLI